ncbi:AFG2-interacting ribosome maturation factor, partial [Lepisosteus oculatus]|uniref:AFG2-interacting ribosome maturation factor n=1 Tax=Lepisosteus oculatus TaxID=7918 RepID=UPI0035F52A71
RFRHQVPEIACSFFWKSALPQLQQGIQKCFKVVELQRSAWSAALGECAPLLGSLDNLAEQLAALDAVSLNRTALGRFPGLQRRLQYKLLRAADTLLLKLGEKLSALQSVRDAISNQVMAVFQLYEQNGDAVGLAACVERSALSPSVADMLEWLQDIDRFYRDQFLKRKLFLQSIKPDSSSDLQTISQSWGALSQPDREGFVSDALMKVSFFVDSY